MAMSSPVGKKMYEKGLRQRLISPKHSFLCTFVMQERRKPNSIWDPYLDILPKCFDNFPIFFNEEEKKWRQRNKFVAGRALDYKLLVFPFVGDPCEIESAAQGLTEAARNTLPPGGVPTETLQQHQTTKFMETDSDNNEDDDTKRRHRAHFVTITVEDYDRLDPGEWLNDSLVDFWMQW